MSDITFGKELRRLRRSADLTLNDLATAAGCSVVYVSQIERGAKPPPSIVHISAMLKAIGCAEKFPDMVRLAIKSRKAVEFELKNRSPEETEMLVTLARSSDELGRLDPEFVQQILAFFNKKAGNDGK